MGGGLGGASRSDAELRATAGETRGLERLGHSSEQIPDHTGDGGVVFGGEPARLAVESGSTATVMFLTVRMVLQENLGQRSGNRDQRRMVIDLFAVCAKVG